MISPGIRLPAIAATCAALLFAVPHGWAQREVTLLEPDEAQAQLTRATRESQRAEARAARLAREAAAATEAAERTAREAASIAAQIQAAEADIAAAQARYALASAERAALSARLAERQQPLVRLTAALQTTARRPLALSALQPGSLKDLVHVRAVLDSAVPRIRRQTAALRSELERGRRIERRAAEAIANLRAGEDKLQARRSELAAMETRQRIASRDARAVAARESERALALAEEARDLDGLVDTLGEAARLRRELAALPGPILRPANIAAEVADDAATVSAPAPSSTRPPGYQLPVQGRIISGFGERRDSGLRSTGVTLAPAPGAQVIAPSSGRVAFAGPYRGFGQIAIIEHPGGWTSLVTGLSRNDVAVGDTLIAGAPLGVAGRDEPVVTVELRRDGEPVNPLDFLR
ncbi:murein hydrolase activator EnvC family protein [Qipengyuania nanhaisediminis]|uniref:murein hydrolase activator EnvC family protein n=1 Tax=Qipengyuania nanhaisediminis TaxID=604088 RepID=UPI0038B2F666